MQQERIGKNSIFITNSDAAHVEDLAKKDAANVKVRYLIDERQGSEHFALRLYTVEKGGHTPLDQHEYEHHVYILSGQGSLREGDGRVLRPLRHGDAVFIHSNAVHQFINQHDEPLVFLCVKGNPSLYTGATHVQTQPGEGSARSFC